MKLNNFIIIVAIFIFCSKSTFSKICTLSHISISGPGQTLYVSGSGFTSLAYVKVKYIKGTSAITNYVQVSPNGQFSDYYNIPVIWVSGNIQVEVTDSVSSTMVLSALVPITTNVLNPNFNVNIPDANFKAALIGDTSINTNNDSEIQVSEALAIPDLGISISVAFRQY
jgi:hypothetical protein